MKYEDLNLDDVIGSLQLVDRLLSSIKDKDIIKDGLTETIITSKFPNIFYYKSVTKQLLINQDSAILLDYHVSDSFREMRLIDFIKDSNGSVSINYNTYYKEFLEDLVSLLNAYVNSVSYPEYSYLFFRSKLFKQYIINIVYICIDIHNS